MGVAVVTNECQRGAIGDLALWPALVDAARPMLAALVRLLGAARERGLPIVHCLAERRADLLGAPLGEAMHDRETLFPGFV